uniref:hypothetical protein n=1 Tax=Marinobacterium profundum TaxID=1714300 RepID=UPI0008376738|nr:hypothetical protein [Marinobacterium profundum]
MNLQPQRPARQLQPQPTPSQQSRSQSRQHLLSHARAIRQQARGTTDLWLAAQYEAAAQLL